MEEEKEFGVNRLIVRSSLVVLLAAISLGSVGCGVQMAKIEQSRFDLQEMWQTSAQQIASDTARIEDNQSKSHVAIEDVQAGNDRGEADIIAAIEQEQSIVLYIMQKNNEQLANSMTGIGQDQATLQRKDSN